MDDCFLAKIGCLEFQSSKPSVWVGFVYTEICMVWPKMVEHLVSKNRVPLSLAGSSIVILV